MIGGNPSAPSAPLAAVPRLERGLELVLVPARRGRSDGRVEPDERELGGLADQAQLVRALDGAQPTDRLRRAAHRERGASRPQLVNELSDGVARRRVVGDQQGIGRLERGAHRRGEAARRRCVHPRRRTSTLHAEPRARPHLGRRLLVGDEQLCLAHAAAHLEQKGAACLAHPGQVQVVLVRHVAVSADRRLGGVHHDQRSLTDRFGAALRAARRPRSSGPARSREMSRATSSAASVRRTVVRTMCTDFMEEGRLERDTRVTRGRSHGADGLTWMILRALDGSEWRTARRPV